MAIIYHPRPGQILMCDFRKGFKEPEMNKYRPVLVLTPGMKGRAEIVTVVGFSTAKPNPVMNFHCQVPKASLPMTGYFQKSETWVKGDMIYAIGFHRLDLIKLGTKGPDGRRQYFTRRLSREKMREIYGCVLQGLNLGALVRHIPE